MRRWKSHLARFGDKRLARIWCRLNRSEWPKELAGFNQAERHQIMRWISSHITTEVCLQEWREGYWYDRTQHPA